MILRTSLLSLACLSFFAPLVGCRRTEEKAAPAPQITLTLLPTPPVVGDSQVTLVLVQPDGKPVRGAKIDLEGNMNHAGMKPSLAKLAETSPGTYTGTLAFTMGGDWYVMATVTLPDGARMEKKIDVRGVGTP